MSGSSDLPDCVSIDSENRGYVMSRTLRKQLCIGCVKHYFLLKRLCAHYCNSLDHILLLIEAVYVVIVDLCYLVKD